MRIPSWRELRIVLTMFRRAHGRWPVLLRPRNYSDLMQRRKLFEWHPLYTTFVDKVAVRDYVTSRAGAGVLIPQVWVGDDPRLLPFGSLPYPVVIKPNHLSGWLHMLHEAPQPDEAQAIIRECERWLAGRHGHLNAEPAYYKVRPRIIAEHLIANDDGSESTEYRVFVFHGVASFITVTNTRFHGLRTGIYDRDWNRLPFSLPPSPTPAGKLPRPPQLARILEVAETLAQGFDFLRIDLYELRDQVLFGEITIYPSSGLRPFRPVQWERIVGDLWTGRRSPHESLAGLVSDDSDWQVAAPQPDALKSR